MAKKLSITVGADWGCEHSIEDGENYAAFAQQYLAQAFGGVTVEVEYDDNHIGRDAISAGWADLDKSEVREVLQQAWDAFCDAGWPRAAAEPTMTQTVMATIRAMAVNATMRSLMSGDLAVRLTQEEADETLDDMRCDWLRKHGVRVVETHDGVEIGQDDAPSAAAISDVYRCGTDIAIECAKLRIVPELIAERGEADARTALWRVGEVLAISTNGNSIWEDDAEFQAARAEFFVV